MESAGGFVALKMYAFPKFLSCSSGRRCGGGVVGEGVAGRWRRLLRFFVVVVVVVGGVVVASCGVED